MKALSGAFSVLTFFGRHGIAVLLATVVVAVLWTVIYAGLLLWAMVANSDVGGPLAYPAGLLVFVLGVVLIGGGVFVPACGMGRLFCAAFKLSLWWAIPVVFVSGFLILLLVGGVGLSMSIRESLTTYLIFLSLPLAGYWLVTEGAYQFVELWVRWFARKTVAYGQQFRRDKS